MATIQSSKKTDDRMNVKFTFKHFFILMASIMAAMTFTACPGEDSDPDGGENGSGGVAGKRYTSYVVNYSNSPDTRSEVSYDSNGLLIRNDVYYTESSKRIMYEIITSNPDGTLAKHEQYMEDMPGYKTVWEYSYDSNKTLLKRQGTTFMDGVVIGVTTMDYTFQNGRKIRDVLTGNNQVDVREYNYDSNGRRTTTTHTTTSGGNVSTKQYTRIYNADGTLQKVTGPDFTVIYTWENGKTAWNYNNYCMW